MCTIEDIEVIEYLKSLLREKVLMNIDNACLNRNDMECLRHGDMQLDGEVSICV
jgi:hypothetical protein